MSAEILTLPATHDSHAVPLQQEQRVQIIDAIRGVALLGILLMNIPFFGMPIQYDFNLNIRNEYSGANYYTWWIVNGYFEGTMRALFSMLFGAGSLLLLLRLEKKELPVTPADLYYRRILWLLAFGVFNAFILLWPGDILYAYAVAGLFLYPFRNLKAKTLLIISLSVITFATLRSTISSYDTRQLIAKGKQAEQLEKKKVKLTEEQKGDLEKWQGFKMGMDPKEQKKKADKIVQKMQGNYFQVMKYLAGWNVKFEGAKYYSSTFWDVIAFFFLGMALFKWGVLTGQRSNRFYAILLVAGYLPGLLIRWYTLHTFVQYRFHWGEIAQHLPVGTYQIERALMALGHLGLLMLLYKSGAIKGFFKAMSNVGQMAFSNYLMQSIICTLIFYGYGLRWYGALQRYQLYYIVVGVWVFQIIFSTVWLRYFRFGPFEWAWRSLTYWKKQPMKRTGGIEAQAAFYHNNQTVSTTS